MYYTLLYVKLKSYSMNMNYYYYHITHIMKGDIKAWDCCLLTYCWNFFMFCVKYNTQLFTYIS